MEQYASGQARRSLAIKRYSRQLVLEGVGAAGQQAWSQASVQILGDGPAAWIARRYLRAAGVQECQTGDLKIDLNALSKASSLEEAARGVDSARRTLLQLLPGSSTSSDSTVSSPLRTGRLKASKLTGDPLVVVVGAGGLGCPALLGLLWAGVKRLRILDDDVVEISNLPRQILHSEQDLGRPKAISAAEELEKLSPGISMEPLVERLEAGNYERLFAGADLIIEGSDNFPTKFRVNAATRQLGIPSVIGGVIRYEGQVFGLSASRGTKACYRCFFPQMPAAGAVPTCSTAGVLGPVAGAVAIKQVAVGLSLLESSTKEEGAGLLELYEGKTGEWNRLRGQSNSDCIACGAEADDPTLRGSAEEGQMRCGG